MSTTTVTINGITYDISSGKADTGTSALQISQRVAAAEWNAAADALVGVAGLTGGIYTPVGAVGDGSADDSAAIQAAIDACQANFDGGVVRLVAGKTYRIDTGLIMSGDRVTFDARGARINAGAAITMLRIDNLGARAPINQRVLGGLWNANSVGVKGIEVRAGQNLVIDDVFVYAATGVGIHLNGDPALDTHGGGGYRFLSIAIRNCLTEYCGKGFFVDRQVNPNFTGVLLSNCSSEINVDGFVISGGNRVVLDNCEAQASSGTGFSVTDGTVVIAHNLYVDNGGGLGPGYNAVLSGASHVYGGGNSFGDVVLNGTSAIHGAAYVNTLGTGYVEEGTKGLLADNNVVGSPNWPVTTDKSPALQGHVAVLGQVWTDVMGTPWLCTKGGTNNAVGGARWVPRNGRIIWPFDYTRISNGWLMFWMQEDFVLTGLKLVITQQFLHGSATPSLSFGNGVAGQEWFSEAQLPYASLVAGAVFDARDNAHGNNLLGGTKNAFLAGVGGRSADAGTSSFRQYANPNTAGWTQGKAFLIAEGINLVNQANIVYAG